MIISPKTVSYTHLRGQACRALVEILQASGGQLEKALRFLDCFLPHSNHGLPPNESLVWDVLSEDLIPVHIFLFPQAEDSLSLIHI